MVWTVSWSSRASYLDTVIDPPSSSADHRAMQVPDDARRQLCRDVSLATTIGGTVELAEAGAALRGSCPWHPDPIRGLYVRDDLGFYHCFSCGRHGDVVTWAMDTEQCSEGAAIALLSGRAGTTDPAH